MSHSERTDAIAAAFVAARRSAAPLAGFPGALPATLADAYAVQDAAIARWPDRFAGWKVAGIAPAFRDRFNVGRIAGPAFARNIFDGTRRATFPVFAGGFAAVEAEFIARMGMDLSAEDAANPGRVAAAVASLHAGAEIASSPFAKINDLGPISVISDFGNNAGLILGPEIPGWRTAPLDVLTSRTFVNGALAGEGSAARVAGGPLAAVAFLATALAARGRRLRAGDLVSTGMTTGIHPVSPGDEVRFDFAGAITIEAVAAAARPVAE